MKTWGVGWTKAGERGLYPGASCHKLEGPCWSHKQQLLVSTCRSQEDAADKDRAWGRVHLGGTEDLLGPRDALWDQTVDSWKFSQLGHPRLNSPLYCCCPVTKWSPTLFDPTNYSMPGFPILHHLPSSLKFMSIESVMLSDHPIFCHPLLLLHSVFSSIRVFSNQSALHISCPKYWSFASVFPMTIQGWFPLGLTGLISLQSKGLSRVFSNTTVHHFIVFYW